VAVPFSVIRIISLKRAYSSEDGRLCGFFQSVVTVVWISLLIVVKCVALDVVDTGPGVRPLGRMPRSDRRGKFLGSAAVVATARHHGISNQLLFSWRKAYREGQLGGCQDGFVPPGLCWMSSRRRSVPHRRRLALWSRDREWPTRDRGS